MMGNVRCTVSCFVGISEIGNIHILSFKRFNFHITSVVVVFYIYIFILPNFTFSLQAHHFNC